MSNDSRNGMIRERPAADDLLKPIPNAKEMIANCTTFDGARVCCDQRRRTWECTGCPDRQDGDTPQAATVFTLTETADRTGYVLGVFADREKAVDAARSHAQHRAERCRAQDAKSFGFDTDGHAYKTSVSVVGEMTDVFVIHHASGEHDGTAWHVHAFEVIAL